MQKNRQHKVCLKFWDTFNPVMQNAVEVSCSKPAIVIIRGIIYFVLPGIFYSL